MQGYYLNFDTHLMKYKAEIVKINETDLESEIHRLLGILGYDIFEYSEDVVIFIDDQGFNKSGKPVFEIISEYGDVNYLVGGLLFLGSIENEYSTDITSISDDKILFLRDNLKTKFVGLTKGVD